MSSGSGDAGRDLDGALPRAPPAQGQRRPSHPLGPRVVLALPDFQLRLVDLVDKLLALLESDTSYPRFLFDGQMAAVDDYLEIRPENERRLRRLAAAGRISFGPWYILMDEFLVSGETIVRNLSWASSGRAAFGGAMEVGYLPDMFGHVAQMPQILRAAGFADAVVWRGVPACRQQDGLFLGRPGRLGAESRVPARRLRDGRIAARRRQGVRAAPARLSRRSTAASCSGPTAPILYRTAPTT